jgi:hypothetical protein
MRKLPTRLRSLEASAAGVASGATRWAAGHRSGAEPQNPFVLIAIYRSKNAASVRRLVSEALAIGGEVRLWALDSQVPGLEGWTAGSGPGLRSDLLNRLVMATPVGQRSLVVADDDVNIVSGRLGDLLRLGGAAQFKIWQPAHGMRSFASHTVSRSRFLAVARTTRLVEIGPMFVVSNDFVPRVFPLDVSLGMGWGEDFRWARFADDGVPIGVIDCVQIRHLSPIARDYVPARSDARDLAEEVGGYPSLLVTTGVWWPWKSRAPWIDQREGVK